MGIEHYYWVIDRTVIDPFLALSWREFHKKLGWDSTSQWKSAAEFFLEFEMPVETDPKTVERILATRTVGWSMRHSSQPYWFLEYVIPTALRRRCPQFDPSCLEETAMIIAAAVYGFLQGRVDRQTLFAVLVLIDGIGWLKLRKSEEKAVLAALPPLPQPKPFVLWQTERGDSSHSCLGLLDTRRFLRFLKRAWKERWPCSLLSPESQEELPVPTKPPLTMRDCEFAGKLIGGLRSKHVKRLCVLRCFET